MREHGAIVGVVVEIDPARRGGTGRMTTYDVGYSGGTQPVTPGETVWMHDIEWIIGEPSGERFYSPSSLGGALTFPCKPASNVVPFQLRKYIEEDGSIIFCGDSIAAALARDRQGQETT